MATQMNGTPEVVPLSSPRTVAVEDVIVTPRHGADASSGSTSADIDAISQSTTHSQTIAALNAKAQQQVEFSSAEQDSVYHSLYSTVPAAASTTSSSAASTSSDATTSAASAAVSSSSSAPAASPSAPRLCLSIRANDLLSPAWFCEATTLAALFSIDVAAGANKYQLLSQTELARDNNSPVYRTQFVLERGSGLARRQSYMVRVYDADSEVIDEAGYLGLAIFSLEELLQNTKGGGFVSIVLPLLNPSNAGLDEQLRAAHASVTLSLQIPVEAGASTPAVGQSVHQYTRLLNFLAPNAHATIMNLNLSLDPKDAEGQLLSVWYRSRSTALFHYIGYFDPKSSTTFVVSNELFLSEAADASSSDEAEAGFEVRVVRHEKAKLPNGWSGNGKLAEKHLGKGLNALSAGDEEKGPAFKGAATVSFKTLMASLDSADDLLVTLQDASGQVANLKVKLTTRASVSEETADEKEESAAASIATSTLTVPTLPSSLPPELLRKAHDLLRAGLYFTRYTSSASPKDIFLQLKEGSDGGKSSKLVWRAAEGGDAASEESILLSNISNIYGGKESSEFFASVPAEATSVHDCLLCIQGETPSDNLALQASSWQTRDTFLFSILSFQASSGLTPALWHPAGLNSDKAKPRIVAKEKPAAAVRAQLGGSHGSLARSPPSAKTAISPASPTSPSSPSATSSPSSPSAANTTVGDVDLGEVLGKLEKLFESGRNFIRFTSGSHKPHYIAMFLRKSPASASTGNKPMFTIYWCKADTRTISATRSLRADEIQGIALGKQTTVFRKEEASLAPSAHCFSIIGTNKSLHLQSWNERDCDTYAFGLLSLFRTGATKPKLWQAGQYSESSSRLDLENQSEQLEEPDGTAHVNPQDVPALANAQGYKCAIELSIKCKGLPSKHNNHIVCVFDRDEESEKLTYLAQTEKQTRAVNPEFRKVFKLTYDSTQMRKLRFNVYDIPPGQKQMDDEDRIGSAMMLVKEVVDGAGIEFVYPLRHENPAKQAALVKGGATIVIQCSNKSEMSQIPAAAPAAPAAPAS